MPLLSNCNKLNDWFGVGSFNYTEKYYLNYSMDEVIKATEIFKLEHPEMCLVDTASWYQDGYHDPNKLWYMVCYRYPEKELNVTTWIRDNGTHASIVGFVALWKNEKGTTKSVNKDFSNSENKEIKREFESRILNPIKEILQRKWGTI